MKIATKIVLACTVLCALGVVITGGFIGWKSSVLAEEALYNRASQQLISVREIKKNEIQRYFDQISGQVTTLAGLKSTQEAMLEFTQAFKAYPTNQVSSSDITKLNQYYSNQFGTTYRESNNGQSANESQRLSQIPEIGIALQARYIAVNPNGLGEKHQMESDSLGTDYDGVHKKHHPGIKSFLEQFGYYDIFLVDLDGNIVYSVFKELDFATNLTSGPYQDSGIAVAYREGMKKGNGQFYLEDFYPYYPSYEAAASFISTPVFTQGKRSGVLIFQMPVDEINALMTFDGKWQFAGLGNTGETYLVGPDKLMRSQPRMLIEDDTAYFEALKATGVSNDLVTQISDKGSAIGRQRVDSETLTLALTGQSGMKLSTSSTSGKPVFSAYAPVTAAGMKWAILTELTVEEALRDVEVLVEAEITTALICIVIVVIAAIVLSYMVGNSISQPIRHASEQIKEISHNNDLTSRLTVNGKDEMAELAGALNTLFEHLQGMIRQFAQATDALNSNTRSMSSNMNNTRSAVSEQSHKADSVATAVNQMSASIAEVAQFANRAAEYVTNANHTGNEGMKIGTSLGDEISQLDNEMKTAVEAIERLNAESNSIAEVLDVIQGIAEQTNLLALNAAIEAARAGEQGRGFAVVADEVRSLAGRTQSSTEEIRSKIDALQKETQGVAQSIQHANQTVSLGVETCHQNTDMLGQIVDMLSQLNEMTTQIAAAAAEQKAVTEDISGSITSIADASGAVSEQVNNVDEVIQDLSGQSDGLNKEIAQFKY
ncbi:methyl-accepting chemotaxis protein [Vibrio sp. TRT 21S02]|uniref:methyl-accepting chemotaxis protein n=1 Tax=Vibrio sp. TRT 21S02 TaxID=3418507 RepID=UPI003CE719D6